MINVINSRQYLLFIMLLSCAWVALTQAETVIERDPFANLTVNDCRHLLSTQENDLKKWQLLGIIGQKGDWVGWVLTEQGDWLMLKTKSALLNKGLQVLTINPTSVELISLSAQESGCQTSSKLYLTMPLEKKHIEISQ